MKIYFLSKGLILVIPLKILILEISNSIIQMNTVFIFFIMCILSLVLF